MSNDAIHSPAVFAAEFVVSLLSTQAVVRSRQIFVTLSEHMATRQLDDVPRLSLMLLPAGTVIRSVVGVLSRRRTRLRCAYLYSIRVLVLLQMRFHQYFICPSISGNLPITRKKARHQFSLADRSPSKARRIICSG